MNFRHIFINQTWWGKFLGALLGFLMAGPAGALFGIIIGNFFDRGLREHFDNPCWAYHAEKRPTVRAVFIKGTFSVIGHLTKADGRVSETEIAMANTLIDELRLHSRQIKIARQCFNEGKQSSFNLNETLKVMQKTLYNNPNLLKLFIDIAYRAAQCDGLSEKKVMLMNTILSYSGFAPIHEQARFNDDFYRESRQHYHTPPRREPLSQAYALLHIPATATKQEVKRAYQRLISRHHPDKAIAKGHSAELVQQANEKTQRIRKAYEEICKSKGW